MQDSRDFTLNIARIDRDAGVFSFTDGTTLSIDQLDRVIPCFTTGSRIATPKGEVAVERLKVGDRVLTRDNGIQTIRWLAKRKLDHLQLKRLKELLPIRIKAGALGGNRPEQDMIVSPMHRMLVLSDLAREHFGEAEVLVAAKDLTMLDGVEVAEVPYVTYVHFLCDQHEIVLCDGTWSESFQPADLSLKGMDDAQREELLSLFPSLDGNQVVKTFHEARRTVSRDHANILFSG